MIEHLKNLHILENDYSLFQGGTAEDCDKVIQEFSDQSINEAIKKNRARNMKKCFFSYLKRHKYAEDSMERVVVEADVTMSPKFKTLIISTIDARDQILVIKATGVCKLHKEFGEIFDEIMNAPHNSTAEDENPTPFYCARQHVLANKEIGPNYKIKMNPKHVNMSAAHCTEFYAAYVAEIKLTINETIDRLIPDIKSLRHCIRNKMYNNKQFIDGVLILEVLCEIQLTEAQKETEKNRFVATHDKVFEQVLECV